MGRARNRQAAVGIGARFDAGLSAARGQDAQPEPTELERATEHPEFTQGKREARATDTAADATREAAIEALGFTTLLKPRSEASTDKLVRPMQRERISLEEFKEQENAFVVGANEELAADIHEFARSDSEWARFQRLVARSPHSSTNELWKRIQLNTKHEKLIEAGELPADAPNPADEGLTLSASDWKKLGGRVQDPYFHRTEGDYDPRYVAEISTPMGFNYAPERKNGDIVYKTDKAGNVLYDDEGKPKPKMRKLNPKSFGTQKVYHQFSVQAKDGGEFALPEAPWENATGSDEDARKLLGDLQTVASEEGMELVFGEVPAPGVGELPEHATFDAAAKRITVDQTQSAPEQAAAALRALCANVDVNSRETQNPDVDAKVRAAGIESAKYAIASLYGLDAKTQSFPYLAELAGDTESGAKLVARVSSESHGRVTKVLSHLDPVMRIKARAQGERRRKAKKSPRKKTKASKAAVAS